MSDSSTDPQAGHDPSAAAEPASTATAAAAPPTPAAGTGAADHALDPEHEGLFALAQFSFLNPPSAERSTLLFFALLLAFILSLSRDLLTPSGIASLLGVLLFHEAGHLLAMRLFGFKDLRMFFVPYLGAIATGRAMGASASKHALVSLLGPVPGILFSFIGFLAYDAYPTAGWQTFLQMMLFLNLFNLLPLGGLDGGRFLQTTLFSRHRVLEIVFAVVSSLGLIAVAFALQSWALAVFAVLGLMTLPLRVRVRAAAQTLRREFPLLSPDPAQLSEREQRALFSAALTAFAGSANRTALGVANVMRSILDAIPPPPRLLATLGLLSVYGFSWILGLMGLAMWSTTVGGPPEWGLVHEDGWQAELPNQPMGAPTSRELASGTWPGHEWMAITQGRQKFTVEALYAGDRTPPDRWPEEARDALIRERNLPASPAKPISAAGLPGVEFEQKSPHAVYRTRCLRAATSLYCLTASAPQWGADQDRFFRSFRLAAPK